MTKPFSVATLAQYLDVTPDTIRRMIRRGELPAYRVGGKLLRIRAEDVAKWVENGVNMRLENTGSSSSRGKLSSSGTTRKAVTAEDWATRAVK